MVKAKPAPAVEASAELPCWLPEWLQAENLQDAWNAGPEKIDPIWLVVAKHGPDSVLKTEIRRRFRPDRIISIPTAYDSLPKLVEDLKRGDSFAVEALAGKLAMDFDDHHSYRNFKSKIEDVFTGKRPIEGLEDAIRQAHGPKTKNPGKIFNHAIKAWEHQHRQSPPFAGR